ncbi:MAG: ATP-binding cassette domain-containing protein, partial [Cyanobacteria bacterium]|nr:ATP-binding cassette domain-containing protein [Cyanobacteriota bacterium]
MAFSSSTHHHHLSPWERLMSMLNSDRKDLMVLVVYTVISGLLSLALPLAAQSLVNTIAAGVLLQPIFVLTFLVFLGLLMAGVLRLFQMYLVEILQKRIFTKVALRVASTLPQVRQSALSDEYAPELVNRFFDVLTIQKTWAKILMDGPAAVLQVTVGLLLLAFYHPLLIAFDLAMILFMVLVIVVLGRGGLSTSIQESIQKYKVAQWLEELGRCQVSLKMNGVLSYLVKRADSFVMHYITDRHKHFRVIFRQAIGNYLFQAIASAGILGVGGFLVVDRQITLGQLVASEIVVVSVLSAIDKLIQLIPDMYDLLTGVDKVGHITDLPIERMTGSPLVDTQKGLALSCKKVHFRYREGTPILSGLNLSLEPGERVSVVGASGVGKSTLASLLCGLYEPFQGMITVNHMDVRDLDLTHLREAVSLCRDNNEIFEGTLEDNILVGRDNISYHDMQWVLDITHLTEDVTHFPEGLKTHLVSEGQNISRGQRQLLLLARALVGHPGLVLLDDSFTGIPENRKISIINEL